MPKPMKQRTLGNQGLTVSAIGLGCMGLTLYAVADVFSRRLANLTSNVV